MEHVVFSAAVDGAGEEFRRVSSLEEAVRVVEHLRNDLGIEDSSVFALTPVPLAFRTYYRVEVPGAEVSEAELPPVEVPALEEPARPVAQLHAVSEMSDASESADLPELGMEVPELADPPAMPSPGLAPRDSESVEGETEHSLGYFTR